MSEHPKRDVQYSPKYENRKLLKELLQTTAKDLAIELKEKNSRRPDDEAGSSSKRPNTDANDPESLLYKR